MTTPNPITNLNLRGALLFWVSIILAFIVLANSDEGVTWEVFGLFCMAFLGVVHLIYSLHKYGKWLEEKEQRNREL